MEVVCACECLRQIRGGPPSGRSVAADLDAVVRKDRHLLGSGVDHEGKDPVPRPRALRCATLVAVRQRGRVPMMAIGDQERFVAEPRGDILFAVDRPHPMLDTLVVADDRDRTGFRRPIEEFVEPLAGTGDRPVDRREVRLSGAKQSQPVLDRSGHRLFVRQDCSTPRLQLEGAHEPAEEAGDPANPVAQLVAVVARGVRCREHPRGAPVREEGSGRGVPGDRSIADGAARQIDVHDVVGAACAKPFLIGLADNVVWGSRQLFPRPRDGRVVHQTAEGGDAWHPLCIAGTNNRHLRTSCIRVDARCCTTGTPMPRP